jgi:hypothetical protein
MRIKNWLGLRFSFGVASSQQAAVALATELLVDLMLRRDTVMAGAGPMGVKTVWNEAGCRFPSWRLPGTSPGTGSGPPSTPFPGFNTGRRGWRAFARHDGMTTNAAIFALMRRRPTMTIRADDPRVSNCLRFIPPAQTTDLFRFGAVRVVPTPSLAKNGHQTGLLVLL